jgi:hypothetical protein
VILDIAMATTWPEKLNVIRVKGTPLDVLHDLREQARKYGNYNIELSWPIDSLVNWGELHIEAGVDFDDAIRSAYAELQDPDHCFDDPAEEAMARLVVRNLYLALIIDTTELVVEQIEEIESDGADPSLN